MGWSLAQYKVFILTFISYALIHAERKTFSNLKPLLHTEWNYNTELMGKLDTFFMICYAFSLLYMGVQSDKFNCVYVLCSGLCGSALCSILFAYSYKFHYNYNIVLYIIQSIHGICQATGMCVCYQYITANDMYTSY